MVYLAELPSHLALGGVPSRVARTGMFTLYKREGDELIFKNRNRNDHNLYRAQVVKNPNTGNEECHIRFGGSSLLLDASNYMHGGRKLTRQKMESYKVEKEWDEEQKSFVETKDSGRTLGDFLSQKAEDIKNEKGE